MEDTQPISLRVPVSTLARIDELARTQHRTRSGQVLALLDQALGPAPVPAGTESHPSGSDGCAAPAPAGASAGPSALAG